MNLSRSVPLLDDQVSTTDTISPVDPSLRIGELDAVRGGALIGVIMMNMFIAIRATPIQVQKTFWTTSMDPYVSQVEGWLVQGKAQFLFGTLFGLGFAIFLDRAQRAGRNVVFPYARRMAFLFVLGVINTFAFFFGDVLHSYAMVGLLAGLSFLPKRLLLTAALMLILFSNLIAGALWSLWSLNPVVHLTPVGLQVVKDALWRAYTHYSPAELAHSSWIFRRGFGFTVDGLAGDVDYLGEFLFGAWLFRSGTLMALLRRPSALARSCLILIPVGLLLSGVNTFGHESLRRVLPAVALRVLNRAATVSLGLGWGGLVAWFAGVRPGGYTVTALKAYGRMALTNYVCQCALILLVFSTAGLGLIRYIGVTLVLPLSLAIAALQAVGSVLWLRRCRFGPLEWVWRNATYGSRQPLLR